MRGFFVPRSEDRDDGTERSNTYEPAVIEAKWQRVWEDEQAFVVPNPPPGEVRDASKTYVVEMLPYPSGELHMGHTLNYTIGDVLVHLRRRRGLQVLRPMGYDAFGLPAENAAIKEGRHPREVTERNIAVIREQMGRMGWAIDWSRELSTATRPTTAGRSGSSCASSRRGSPTARRRRSSGARTTRRCSRTNR